MNKFFSYIYEINWRFLRLQNQSDFPFLPLMTILLWIPVGIIGWFLICRMELPPWLIILTSIPCLAFSLFFSDDFIQEKFKKFESEKVKFGKEVDEKYIELQKICYSHARDTKKIKELANFVFPNLLQLHRKKEVEEKIYHCFRSVVSKDNLDTMYYFIIDLNVKVSEEYSENLKKQYPELEKLFNFNNLNHELSNDLKINKPKQSSKKIKI
jgi:hypothetical protein